MSAYQWNGLVIGAYVLGLWILRFVLAPRTQRRRT